jgi:hypothetical protein
VAPDLAILDSGATGTLLTSKKASERGYNMDVIRNGPTVKFADGTVTVPITHVVNMSEWLKGYVVADLAESLISVRDLTKQGWNVLFTSGGGTIYNNSEPKQFKVRLVNDQYYLDLNDIENIPAANILKSAVSTVNALSSAMSIGERIKDLHERMGHVHPRMMMRALEGKNATWIDADVTNEQIRKYYSDKQNRCLCYLSHANRPKKAVRVQEKSKIPGEVISSDPIFKIYPESYDKDLGCFLFADEATGFLHVFTGRFKSQFFECLQIVERWYRSWGYKIEYL